MKTQNSNLESTARNIEAPSYRDICNGNHQLPMNHEDLLYVAPAMSKQK